MTIGFQLSLPLNSLPMSGPLSDFDFRLASWRMRATAKSDRKLHPMDADNSHTPFPFDIHFMSHLRTDQVPRFLGALTHPQKLPRKTVRLDTLCAIQNRVDTKKVEAIREKGVKEAPTVVRMNNRDYLIDGHHRATAAWLDGDEKIEVGYKDLTEVDNSVKSRRA